jgi:hypothetical protein
VEPLVEQFVSAPLPRNPGSALVDDWDCLRVCPSLTALPTETIMGGGGGDALPINFRELAPVDRHQLGLPLNQTNPQSDGFCGDGRGVTPNACVPDIVQVLKATGLPGSGGCPI